MATETHNPGGVGYPYGVERREIPVLVVRRAFEDSGMSIAGLARRLHLHRSGVGRFVRGHKNHQYTQNADGQVVDYDARVISTSRENALRYIRAMELDPRDYGIEVGDAA